MDICPVRTIEKTAVPTIDEETSGTPVTRNCVVYFPGDQYPAGTVLRAWTHGAGNR